MVRTGICPSGHTILGEDVSTAATTGVATGAGTGARFRQISFSISWRKTNPAIAVATNKPKVKDERSIFFITSKMIPKSAPNGAKRRPGFGQFHKSVGGNLGALHLRLALRLNFKFCVTLNHHFLYAYFSLRYQQPAQSPRG